MAARLNGLFGCALLAAGCDDLFNLEAVQVTPGDATADSSPDGTVEACPPDYVSVQDTPPTSKYRYVSSKLAWGEAAADCADDTETHVTHLVVFDNVTELAAMSRFPSFIPDYFLAVGYARDTIAHGGSATTFYSVTGDVLSPASPHSDLWAANEPNNGGGGPTEETVTFVTPEAALTDGPAADARSYLCECDGVVASKTFQLAD